jgi:ATP-binding cassette, subfamily B (MDR/TAP), member 1
LLTLICLEHIQGDIRFNGVIFSYPARPDVPVLKSFDLVAKGGTSIAIAGPSGCGKSTVIQLLERFYDPAAGSITVDGHDIKALSLEWYRSQVGLVSQEPTLFATTIRENIAMGRPGASDKEIEDAAIAANADRFIKKLPKRFSTQVCHSSSQ